MADAVRERILLTDGTVKTITETHSGKMRARGRAEAVGIRFTVTGDDPVAGAAGAAGAVGELVADGGTFELRSAEEIDLFKVVRNTAVNGAVELVIDRF